MTLGPVQGNCLAPRPGGQAAASKPGFLPLGIWIVTPDPKILCERVISHLTQDSGTASLYIYNPLHPPPPFKLQNGFLFPTFRVPVSSALTVPRGTSFVLCLSRFVSRTIRCS